jgi:dTDP-4-dehydrorhamnose reductase
MIHFSTDYVFDGRLPGSRIEPEAVAPVNAYGRSKLAAERAVLLHPGHLVLRVSWLYGGARPGFVERMMELALAGEPLAAVADKWSVPTSVVDLADWVEALLAIEVSGVLHACAGGNPASWHDVAAFLVSQLHACGALASLPVVRKQLLLEVPALKAERPRHTGMSNERLAAVLGRPLPSWQESLAAFVTGRLKRG